MRFALTVPAGPVPATGWPIAIYSHGTGGDYASFIDDGTALGLAREGIAVISTDQVLHGPRNPGGNPELDFFNFGNPYAARDNALQGDRRRVLAAAPRRSGLLDQPTRGRTHHASIRRRSTSSATRRAGSPAPASSRSSRR